MQEILPVDRTMFNDICRFENAQCKNFDLKV